MPDLPVAKTSTPEGDVRSASLRKGTVRLLRENGRTVVAFAGVWRIGADVPDVGTLDAQIGTLGRIDEVTFSTRELADWDSLLLVAIRKVEAICAAQGLGTVHDALPEGLRTLLSLTEIHAEGGNPYPPPARRSLPAKVGVAVQRSEEHTSELQSH